VELTTKAARVETQRPMLARLELGSHENRVRLAAEGRSKQFRVERGQPPPRRTGDRHETERRPARDVAEPEHLRPFVKACEGPRWYLLQAEDVWPIRAGEFDGVFEVVAVSGRIASCVVQVPGADERRAAQLRIDAFDRRRRLILVRRFPTPRVRW